MTKTIEEKMRKYGVGVTNLADGKEYYAFIEPLRYKSRMYLEMVQTVGGILSESRFLYLGPKEFDVTKLGVSDFIESHGVRYYCVIAEPVYFGDRLIYYRGILKKVSD